MTDIDKFSISKARELPPFPTDDSMLDQLEHALNTSIAYTDDGERQRVGGEFTLPQLLGFLSGEDPKRSTLIGDGAIPIYEAWDPSYSEHDVIRALIARIRELSPTESEAS